MPSGGRGRKFAPRRACEPTDARRICRKPIRTNEQCEFARKATRRMRVVNCVRRTEWRSRESIFSPRPAFSYSDQLFTAFTGRPLSLLGGRIVGVLWPVNCSYCASLPIRIKAAPCGAVRPEKVGIIPAAVRLTTGQRPKQ